MIARFLVAFGLLVAVSNAYADGPFDHSQTRFPLAGRHQAVACESCHLASDGTRKWAGVALDCHGCHGDRRNHKGALGEQCQLCHEASGWKSVKHQAAEHQLALVGKHSMRCASCHAAGAHLTPSATCNDCHTPQDGIGKLICKADNGYRHSKGFTFNDFHEPIQITRTNSEILQQNCIRCHKEFVSAVLGQPNETGCVPLESMNCVRCHQDVGHGPVR